MRLIVLLGFSVCAASAAKTCVLPAGAILSVSLAPDSPKSLKQGVVLEGSIEQPVYRSICRLVPAGVPVKVEAAQGGARVELRPPGSDPISVQAAVVRSFVARRAVAAGKPERRRRVLLLRTRDAAAIAGGEESPSAGDGTIPAGTRVRVALDSAAGSKSSRQGDPVRARLLEPVFIDGKVLLPEGTMVHGTLAGARRARRLYRAGSLRFAFQSVEAAPQRTWNVPLSVSAGLLAGGARIDDEGAITGSALTRKRALLNLAISYAAGKILDDVIEEGAKAIYGMAAAGSAETAARYVGLGVGAAMFLLHRGRDVKLDAHTELLLTFSRPVEIGTAGNRPEQTGHPDQ
jgi:hypothetical protein